MDNQLEVMTFKDFANQSQALVAEIEKAVVGKREVLDKLLAAFLCSGGHVLIEDYPGLAKTLIVNSFAEVLGLEFRRIQFTPDLMPGDITGGYVFDSQQKKFVLRKGPIFTNILLADEINRASPKTQSALLEAMQEHQVTIEGVTFELPDPFIVIATQNPIEYEGTFPLPEAQLDRFLVKLMVGYPNSTEEEEILARRILRKEDEPKLESVLSREKFMLMRQLVEEVHVDPDIRRYIVDLVVKTRRHNQIAVGASPRGSLALLKVIRAWAAVHGRDYVLPDDVKTLAREALSHRIILELKLWSAKSNGAALISEILQSVAVPVIPPDHE